MTEDQQRDLEKARPAGAAHPLWGDLAEPVAQTATTPVSTEEFSTSRPTGWTAESARAKPPPLPVVASEADSRLWLIEQSLACFRLGCISLIPAAGVFPAFLTLHRFAAVRNRGDEVWNPARGHLFGGVWLAVIGCAISTVLLGRLVLLLGGGEGTLLFLLLAIPLPMAVAVVMTVCSPQARRRMFGHPLAGCLGLLLAIVATEWTLFAFSRSPEPWAWPAVFVTLPFSMWAMASVLWRDANESFRDHPGAMGVWLLLATVFGVQGMLALADAAPLALAMSLLVPGSLCVRVLGAGLRGDVRRSCARSLTLHTAWAVISIPLLGAAAHLAGLWDGSVAGTDLVRLLRLDW